MTASPAPAARWITWPGIAALSLLVACAAALDDPLAQAASPAVTPDWPPAWQPDTAPAPEFGAPAFDRPSAQNCRRLPSTREVPGVVDRGQRGDYPSPWAEEERSAAAGVASADAREKREARDASKALRAESAPAAKAMPAPAAPVAQADALRAPPRVRETVTAGMVDDNADFGEYLAYRRRHAGLPVRDRDVSERYLIEVTDAAGRPVHDAEVAVQRAGDAVPLAWARTDTAGRVWLHPRAFSGVAHGSDRQLGIAVRKGDRQARTVLVRGERAALHVKLGAAPLAQRPRLDLVFLIDATGSMGDEIAKLKSSMRTMAQQIAQLPGQPDICWGLVAYRDRGDAFLTRTHDFTDDLPAFQQVLARVQANGGGDMPEALNEALHEVVHGLSWRADAARMVVLVADAPPHLDYGGPQYDRDMQAALAKGIKLFAVGASGLDPVGEYVFRQLAQYTAGRFVFLTYRDAGDPASGPGTQTPHDVRDYSVRTLDQLVVRLVGDEMARLARS